MKKIIWLFLAVIIVSCNSEPNDFVTIKGDLKTEGIDKLQILGNGFSKEISVNKDGSFSDTLKVTDGLHLISNGNDRATIFLRNGYDLTLNFKEENINEGIEFEGNGAETNNFLEKKRLFFMSDFANPKTYFALEKADFEDRLLSAKSIISKHKDEAPNLDSLIVEMDENNDAMFFKYLETNYEKMHANAVRFSKGKQSPVFNNYENYKGGKTSLSDLKGKYVYLDIWATWCKPCKDEIPALKILEQDFHNNNIEFVSISVDKPEAYDTWRNMVKDMDLKGIQLFSDYNFDSEFITQYGINAIPRFILLDPEGNIVDADADRPSNPKLIELFVELGI